MPRRKRYPRDAWFGIVGDRKPYSDYRLSDVKKHVEDVMLDEKWAFGLVMKPNGRAIQAMLWTYVRDGVHEIRWTKVK